MSVALINSFEVAPGREEEFVIAWRAAADFLATRPGYVSTRLHRAVAPGAMSAFVNVAEWASAEQCKAAVTSAEFQAVAKNLADYPSQPGFYSVAYEHRA
jgi:heme-degrading monooxygenase HmoA